MLKVQGRPYVGLKSGNAPLGLHSESGFLPPVGKVIS